MHYGGGVDGDASSISSYGSHKNRNFNIGSHKGSLRSFHPSRDGAITSDNANRQMKTVVIDDGGRGMDSEEDDEMDVGDGEEREPEDEDEVNDDMNRSDKIQKSTVCSSSNQSTVEELEIRSTKS